MIKFHIRKLTDAGFGELHEGEDVLGGAVTADNAFIATYSEPPKVRTQANRNGLVLVTVDGDRIDAAKLVSDEHPHRLTAGERCIRRYALSGSSGEYVIHCVEVDE